MFEDCSIHTTNIGNAAAQVFYAAMRDKRAQFFLNLIIIVLIFGRSFKNTYYLLIWIIGYHRALIFFGYAVLSITRLYRSLTNKTY